MREVSEVVKNKVKLGEGSMESDEKGTRESNVVEMKEVGEVIINEELGNEKKGKVENYGKGSAGQGST